MEDFRQLLTKYQNRVYNQAYRMLGNAEDAEETTQDIFMKVYRSMEDFRGESAVSTWIYRITSNECISRLRKKQLDTTSLDEPFESGECKSLADIIPDEGGDPETLLQSREAAESIRAEVRSLPANWAMAISLYHFDDLSYDEIAKIMDIPTATVATYISRGRKQLAQKLLHVMDR
ncbi:sigma-70 family RNA polymerase sigma factor [bacterium]|nr:sigma-70 family RNA polymerase sigma factor [bacterium]